VKADPLRGGHLFDEALDYCVNRDLRTYLPWSRFYGGLSLINRGQVDQGLETMRGAMVAANKINSKLLGRHISAVLRWPMHEPVNQKRR
jgi:hypothetical protein